MRLMRVTLRQESGGGDQSSVQRRHPPPVPSPAAVALHQPYLLEPVDPHDHGPTSGDGVGKSPTASPS
jgi:hypothetical protein